MSVTCQYFKLMRVLKLISVLILTFGLFMSFFGAALLVTVDRNTQLLEDMQRAGMGKDIDAQELRLIIIRNAVGYEIIGLLSLISGIGLLLRRNWARILWLAIVAVILSLSLYAILWRIWHNILGARDFVGFLTPAAIAVATGWYFCRPKTKSFFEKREVAS